MSFKHKDTIVILLYAINLSYEFSVARKNAEPTKNFAFERKISDF